MSEEIEVVDYYDTDALSDEIDACESAEDLEKLYNEKLAGRTVNVVDETIIQEMFIHRMESLGINLSELS